jgi:hypothetical protein
MKIKISYLDACNFIQQHMTGVSGVEIEPAIVNLTPGTLTYVQGLDQALAEFPAYRSNQKIAAIKRMRELVTGLGLAEAKFAIENPITARQHYSDSGRPYTGN